MTINQDNSLTCIEIEPLTPAEYSIIWLHGLGANGSDFVPIVPHLRNNETAAIRFIFPHAPVMPVTLNHGTLMPAWFDIYAISRDARIDSQGIARSVAAVEKLIAKEIARGIASNHIFLAGFSQGAALALSTGLTYQNPLAGILVLSGFLPQAQEVLANASEANRTLPIFLAHGTEDLVVPYAFGKETCALLKQAGYTVSWHTYLMEHSVCEEEVIDIRNWLGQLIQSIKDKRKT